MISMARSLPGLTGTRRQQAPGAFRAWQEQPARRPCTTTAAATGFVPSAPPPNATLSVPRSHDINLCKIDLETTYPGITVKGVTVNPADGRIYVACASHVPFSEYMGSPPPSKGPHGFHGVLALQPTEVVSGGPTPGLVDGARGSDACFQRPTSISIVPAGTGTQGGALLGAAAAHGTGDVLVVGDGAALRVVARHSAGWSVRPLRGQAQPHC